MQSLPLREEPTIAKLPGNGNEVLVPNEHGYVEGTLRHISVDGKPVKALMVKTILIDLDEPVPVAIGGALRVNLVYQVDELTLSSE